MDLISVIIPVYNVADYISDCLDSVVNQTYAPLDVIVIDDGSTDGSGEICDRYAAAHEEIRVVHQDNRGISGARNAGVEIASGSYIVFIDGDDYIHPDMIRIMHEAAVLSGLPYLRCGYITTSETRNSFVWPSIPKCSAPPVRSVTSEKEMEDVLTGTEQSYVWAAIYETSLIRDLRFPEGYKYEDVLYITQVLGMIPILGRVDLKLCAYVKRKGSITHSAVSTSALDFCHMMFLRSQAISRSFPALSALSAERFIARTMNSYNALLKEGASEAASVLKEKTTKDYLPHTSLSMILRDSSIPLYRKMIAAICRVSFTAACRFKGMAVRLRKALKGKHSGNSGIR